DIKFKFPIWESTEIGSLIADAIKEYVNTQPDDDTPKAQIALVQAGCFKRGLDKGTLQAEFIQDFVMPFTPHMLKAKISGQDILDAINGTANSIHAVNDIGIMQVSGLKYTIDAKKPAGQRVDPKTVLVEKDGKYVPIDLDEKYIVAYDNFLRSGQEVFGSLANGELVANYEHGNPIGLIEYIKNHQDDEHLGDKNYADRINVTNMPQEPLSIKKILGWFGIKSKEFVIECDA
ncbi:MAG: 5'-nucleotidase C-terminal domain-containing protein, partial [Vampirovibrionia bacterium]